MSVLPVWSVGARTGPIRRHKKLVCFACEGLVAIHDDREDVDGYIVLRPSEFRERIVALVQFAKKMVKDDRKWMRQEGRQCLADCQAMMETIKEARDMGDPSDPAVQAYWSRHRTNRSISVSLSAGSDPAGYPELPKVDRGPRTGRTADPGDPFETIKPAATIVGDTKIRQKPRRRPRPEQAIVLNL